MVNIQTSGGDIFLQKPRIIKSVGPPTVVYVTGDVGLAIIGLHNVCLCVRVCMLTSVYTACGL